MKQNDNWKNLIGPDYSIFKGYTILTPDMISGTIGGLSQRYIGDATHLIIDDSFPTDSLYSLFSNNETIISLVILTNKFIDYRNLFMWAGAQLRDIFINTSKADTMNSMFQGSQATTLDLSSFNTSNVTSMRYMFNGSQATSLDLSSFDTSNVTNMTDMFQGSKASIGYARTQADADKFNASSGKPAALNFIVKP